MLILSKTQVLVLLHDYFKPELLFLIRWRSLHGEGQIGKSSLGNTLPITKKNKHTVVTKAPKNKYMCCFAGT